MTKSKFKKALSLLIAVLMCVTTCAIGVTGVFAELQSETEVYLIDYARGDDVNFGGEWGHGSLKYMNGWKSSANDSTGLRAIGSYSGEIAYCIEPGTSQHTGDVLTRSDESFFAEHTADYNKTISGETIALFIGRILTYGYQGNISLRWLSQNDSDADAIAYAYATQLLIWEVVVGERDESFNHVSTGDCNAILDCVSPNHPLHDRIMSHYNSMVASVQNHTKLPSFCVPSADRAENIELDWNGSAYTATLTDTNGVLSDYTFSANEAGVKFSVNGNKLTVTADTAPNGTLTISATKNNGVRKSSVVWTDGVYKPAVGIQDIVSCGDDVADPVQGYLKVKASYGSCQIVKTSDDGKIAGINFNISGNGINKDVVTGEDGKVRIDNLLPGVYTVTEQSDEKYEPQGAQEVTVLAGQTAVANFNNKLKRGSVEIKTNTEDGIVEGVKYHLHGTSSGGVEVDEYAVTDKNGIARFDKVPEGTGYTVEEVDEPERYVDTDKQTVDVKWNEVTETEFSNLLKKWRAELTKKDSELANGTQGDATISGAAYGVYKGDQLIDTYKTDENGYFITDYYACGDDWTIREVAASEGYLLDTVAHHVDAEAEKYTVEYNTVYANVSEQVIKGSIAIVKHNDEGDTQIENPDETQVETPEVGAVFEIYLKAAGSYKNAKDTERAVITCDKDGFGQTEKLPYGVYTVHQVSGWEGRELMSDFDVFVAQDGAVYRYLINNATFKSYIRVVKLDAETGKAIPYAGAAFKIYDANGKAIKMSFDATASGTVDTYYTDADGSLITPEKLPYGKGYYLVEEQAPYGYVLDTAPVYFDVTAENSADENGITVIKVSKENTAQKGTIVITKKGEVFFGVKTSGEGNEKVYQPVFKEDVLKDATFEIRAAEDITTPDGTVRAKKGEVVDTVTTGQDGIARSKELYLGKYEIKEIKAPQGTVINSEGHPVELVYAGQNVSVTETATSIYNDRQKAALSFQKELEINGLFGIGNNSEMKNVVFGLYAAEELVSASGAAIPADGLIEVIRVDEKGTGTVKTDLPFGKYYIKEIATDEHYILNSNKYEFTFSYAGQDTALVKLSINGGEAVENELIYGSVDGMKLDEKGKPVAGALIGLFAKGETKFTRDTALMTTVSARDGKFSFADVPYGEWIVREIRQPAGFTLNETVFDAAVKSDNQVVKVEIVNEYVRGGIVLTKVDADYPENTLSGATFEVYKDTNRNGVIDDADEFVGTLDEKANGVYEKRDLPYGHYLVRETVAPEGFLLDEGVYHVFIDTDKKVYVIENNAGENFIDKPVKGNITLTKIDAEYPENKLTGAVFEVYKDNNADGKLDAGDTLVGTLTETEVGVYEMKDMRYGHYLIKETVAPEGFYLDSGVYSVFIEKNAATYCIENQAGVGFINKAQKGSLKIIKTSTDGKVEGISFRVTGEDGFDVTLKTDANGEILIENLRPGEYTVSEVGGDSEKVTVKADTTTIVKMDSGSVKYEAPDTGDGSHIGLWMSLVGASVIGFAATGFFSRKRKKTDAE